MKYAIAVDIGGTNTRVALVDENMKIINRVQFGTDTENPENTLQQIEQAIDDFGKDVVGVGMSCPGPLDLKKGVTLETPNLGGKWQNYAVAGRLSEITGKPVFLDNDANLAGLGEAVAGAGKDYNYVQFLTISTGIGSGLVINKEIFYGARGFANEVANCVVIEEGPSHGNIVPGGIEAVSSGTAIVERAKKKGLSVEHAGQVNDLAKAGNADAIEIMNDAKIYLANFLSFIQGYTDPEIIILGGSVALKIPGFISDVEELLRQRVFQVVRPFVNVKPTALGEDSGLIGAGFLAFDKTK